MHTCYHTCPRPLSVCLSPGTRPRRHHRRNLSRLDAVSSLRSVGRGRPRARPTPTCGTHTSLTSAGVRAVSAAPRCAVRGAYGHAPTGADTRCHRTGALALAGGSRVSCLRRVRRVRRGPPGRYDDRTPPICLACITSCEELTSTMLLLITRLRGVAWAVWRPAYTRHSWRRLSADGARGETRATRPGARPDGRIPRARTSP
mmetsp:Transcript_10108/g.24724  ORF Transcript_10108/g.24724 Transcript_10108/m.24724 type:complete len:202 (-) Transcript_10108:475-1080(-)